MGLRFKQFPAVPIVFAPLIGGLLIGKLGLLEGVRTGLVITLALAIVTVLLLSQINVPVRAMDSLKISGVWRSFDRALKRLLISDIIVRMCEGYGV